MALLVHHSVSRSRSSNAASRRIRGVSSLAVAVALLFPGAGGGAAGVLGAQTAAASSPRGAVLLRLHPRVGDTLRTRLDQQTEVSGHTKPGGGAPKSMTTTVTVLARTIVQASRATTTTVLTIVDSAMVESTDPHAAAMSAHAERALRGQQLVLQMAEDGSVQSARDVRGVAVPTDVAEAMAAMPAIFPHRAVSVGEKWQREMPLPAGPMGAHGSAHMRAEFRLDSLARGGELAFVSMRGAIVSDGARDAVQLSGTVSGAMQVDRARGWMTDSRFSVMIRSLMPRPGAAGQSPMQFVTKVTQRLRTMDKR